MKIKYYLIDKIPLIILQMLSMIAASTYLGVIGVNQSSIGFLCFTWSAVFLICLACSYQRQKRHFKYLQSVLARLEKKYLVTQVTDRPYGLTERFYFDLLRQAEKSMMEEITAVRHLQQDYKEYIEQWIHEMKGPLTSLKLKCENDKSGILQTVIFETGQIENHIEQALFFARSESMEKDCLIQQVVICDAVNSAIIKNKHLLVNTIALDLMPMSEIVYTDGKWLEFIIGQIIINAVKYRNESNSLIKFDTIRKNDHILLSIEDNGIGILPSELPRIFDKGFTGLNGRDRKQSTGLGLYLCKQLCDRLGHKITVDSIKNQGTTFTIRF